MLASLRIYPSVSYRGCCKSRIGEKYIKSNLNSYPLSVLLVELLSYFLQVAECKSFAVIPLAKNEVADIQLNKIAEIAKNNNC